MTSQQLCRLKGCDEPQMMYSDFCKEHHKYIVDEYR